MPPRTALVEIATRSNNYVCRSCTAALGISHPQRFLRGYARKARPGRASRQQVTPPPEPATVPKKEVLRKRPPKKEVPKNHVPSTEAPQYKPVVNYFEKDPETGEVTPVQGLDKVEDDGDDAPSFADLARVARSAMAKFDLLDETFAKLSKLSDPLERILEKHGPPGGLEAYRAAVRSYDEADEQTESTTPDLEPDPNAAPGDFLKNLKRVVSGSGRKDLPDLKEAMSTVQDAINTLEQGANGDIIETTHHTKYGAGPVSDEEFDDDILEIFDRRAKHDDGLITDDDSKKDFFGSFERRLKQNAGQVTDFDEDSFKTSDRRLKQNARQVTDFDEDSLDFDEDSLDFDGDSFQAPERRPKHEATVQKASLKNSSLNKAGVKKASINKASVEETGVKELSLKEASVRKTRLEKASMRRASSKPVRKVTSGAARYSGTVGREPAQIWFDESLISRKRFEELWPTREALLEGLQDSMKASSKTDRERKISADKTQKAFRRLVTPFTEGYAKANDVLWKQLWSVFSYEGPSNHFRMSRVKLLVETMIRAGVSPPPEQQVLAIQATFELEHPQKAIDWWKRLVGTVGSLDSRTGLAFWELGVKIWCAHGDVARAERATKALLDRSTASNPADTRVLLHLIQAYCVKTETAEEGFLLYRRMRDLAASLEKPMEIQDYDVVISLFLQTGHTDYAMFTFTDMMHSGVVNLYGKVKLPSHVRNHFFFGKWLKRLIGAGDLDGAFDVLIYMQQNGVMPAAVQVNGLIGAWIRTRVVANRDKAYKLAWAMIRSRESFVNLRKRESIMEWPIRLRDNRPDSTTDAEDRSLDYDLVPRATLETFIIMAGDYRKRGLFTKLEELFIASKKCEMPRDAMMMNELLKGLVAQGYGTKARSLYRSMVHEHGMLPSTDTFAVLFSSLPVNREYVGPLPANVAAESARAAREIFADMMRSAWVYMEKLGRRGPASPLSETQAKLILHTFRKADDLAGLSVVLLGLRDVLEYRITRGVMLEMIEGVEHINKPTPRMNKAVVRATITLQNYVLHMQRHGQIPQDATSEGMKDWRLLYQVLLQWFFSKMRKRENNYAGTLQAGTLLQEARREMGLENLNFIMPADIDELND